jgi:hypothetical protein
VFGFFPLIWVQTHGMVLWDGTSKKEAVGWISAPEAHRAFLRESGKTFMRFDRTAEKTFVEFGLQWAPWYPPFAGTNLTGNKFFLLDLRITGSNLPSDIGLSLASPGDHHTTARVSLAKQDAKVFDGKWHRFRIPFHEWLREPSKFERDHTIQLILGSWCQGKAHLVADVANVRVEK